MKKLFLLASLMSLANSETMQFTEYVQVSSSTPQYESVRRQEPYEECHDVQVAPQRAYQDNVAGSILGGAIGGVLGHQVGRGQGKDAATIGGAILGTIVGGNVIRNNQGYNQNAYETRRNCTTKYRQSVSSRQMVGYENIGYYKGTRIVKFSNQRMDTIPVTVTVDY